MVAAAAQPVRAFIAIALNQGLIPALKNFQRQLQARMPDLPVRWAHPERLHLTLKFLGHVPRERLADSAAALNSASAGIAPFQLALEGVGCFPHPKNPRVVWIGINGDLPSLRRLQTQIDQQTQGIGDHNEERVFQPHLTLGRVKPPGQHRCNLGELVQTVSFPELGCWTVREIHLMQSVHSPDGARYTTLATATLNEAPPTTARP